MKKVYTLVTAAILLSLSSFSQQQYNGNNNTGFGGVVGPGNVQISNDDNTLYFQINRGVGYTQAFNNPLVFYIDAATGGFSTTANFTDATSDLTKAISGFDGGTNRSTFNFNSDFMPDYAFALFPGTGSGQGTAMLVALANNANFTVISTPGFTNYTDESAASYLITIKLADIGISSSNPSFKFIASYISNTGYRSDEAIGDPMTGFMQGWNTYTSVTSPLVYNSVLAVTFGTLTGNYQNNAVNLNWNIRTETNTKSYEVQKSSDGNKYVNIGTIAARNSATGASYSYTDNGQILSKNYYRIAAVDFDGHISLSNALVIDNVIRQAISLMGNPVNGAIKVQISNVNSGKFDLSLYSSTGQKIASLSYTHPGGVSTQTLYVSRGYHGLYYLVVTGENSKQTIRVVL